MENAIFGMKTLNISQGYFSNFTHKNLYQVDLTGEDTAIDTWRSKMHLKVLKVLPYKTTGFANTVLFGTCDENGNEAKVHTPKLGDVSLTLAMTHDNALASHIKEGAIFSGDTMIYEEGTMGNATGNHIHFEVTKGWVYNKIKMSGSKYYNGAQWCLPNPVAIEDALFLLEGYTRVFNDFGYQFQWVQSIKANGNTTQNSDSYTLYDGTNTIKYKGVTVKAVVQRPEWRPTVIADGMQTLSQFLKAHPEVKSCSNLNYFRNSDILGRCQGDNIDGRPDQKEWLDIVQLKDGDNVVKTGDFASWEYLKDEVLWGSSFGMGLIVEWSKVDIPYYYSTGIEHRLLTLSGRFTVIGQIWDNRNVIMVNEGNLTAKELQDLCVLCGMRNAFIFDGSGSSRLYSEGQTLVASSDNRKVPCYFCFLEKPEEPKPEPQPEPTPEPQPEPQPPVQECEKCKQLQAELDNANAEIAKIKEELKVANINVIELAEVLDEANNKVKELDEFNKALTAANNGLSEKMKNVFKQIRDVKDQLESLLK